MKCMRGSSTYKIHFRARKWPR